MARQITVPHLFRSGDTLTPRAVNENALALYAQAQRIIDSRRYHYYPVILPLGNLNAGDNAAEAEIPIRIPFDCDIVGCELVIPSSTDGSTNGNTETIAITSDITGWVDQSVSLTYGQTDEAYDFQSQFCTISANTKYEFTFTQPTDSAGSGDSYEAYAVLHCRYDTIKENSVTLTKPPQVNDSDTYDTAEWATWHATFKAEVQALVDACNERKTWAVYTLGQDLTDTSLGGSHARFKWGFYPYNAYYIGFHLFVLAPASMETTFTLRDTTNAVDIVTETGGNGDGVTQWGNSDAGWAGTISNPGQEDCEREIQVTTVTGAGTRSRHYISIAWQQGA